MNFLFYAAFGSISYKYRVPGSGIAIGRYSVVTGDINGDSKPDIIVGLPYFGQVHILLNITNHQTPDHILTTPFSNPNATNFGIAVAVGKCNNDTWLDVIVGSELEDKVYVFYGNGTGFATTPDRTLTGPVGSSFGTAIAVGDVNNDGISDILVGAANYTNGEAQEGGVFLYQSSSGSLPQNWTWSQESNNIGAKFGWAVALTDPNNDSHDDVFVGAPWWDDGTYPDEGRVYWYNSNSTGLATQATSTVQQFSANALLGYSVAPIYDVTGDGYKDVGIGAEYYNSGAGAFYWYKGGQSGITYGGYFTGGSWPYGVGLTIAGLDDINTDGYADTVLGGYGAWDIANGPPVGPAYITYDTPTTWGNLVARAGDQDQDGFADIIYADPGDYYIIAFCTDGAAFLVAPSPSRTPSSSPSLGYTPSSTRTPTPSMSSTPSPSVTPTVTPSNTATPTSSSSPSFGYTPTPSVTPSSSLSSSPQVPHAKKKSNDGAIIGGVVGGFAALTIGIGIVVAAFLITKRRRDQERQPDDENIPMEERQPQRETEYVSANVLSNSNNDQRTVYTSVQRSDSVEDLKKDTDLRKSAVDQDEVTAKANELLSQQWEIKFSDIKVGGEIGRGGFGVVYKGRWSNCDCVVKQLNIAATDQKAINDFLKEAEMVKHLRNHKNICTIFGVCTNPAFPICIVMEYVSGGNLQKLIFNKELVPTSQQIIKIAMDICAGMSHLHRVNILHCDLACRNLLVEFQGSSITVKITDFGLAHLSHSEVYDANKKSVFPIRWSAPEVLTQLKLSRGSDVWSFGICMWEILEAKTPYYQLQNPEVIDYVCEQRKILSQPKTLKYPLAIWEAMQKCWAFEPEDRPTFDELFEQFSDMTEDSLVVPKLEQRLSKVPVYGNRSQSVFPTNNNQ